ncbi:MAG: capsular biosynthesis protein [Bacillales bacterium]|jgi:O-antigen biosynthesis protein WbqP|nr:capsular biosynthesis protein [Bacillales bacterium]
MYKEIKPIIDFLISLLALLMIWPVLFIIALIIKIDSPGPVLFKQKRFGKDKEFFNILKFRSMRSDAPKDTPTHLLKDANTQITKVGKFLRKSSLDELPQILNILKGEMSVIGPRPALWNQTDLIDERDKYNANSVRPGLTGWAQINGRDELPIVVKARLDGEYVKKINLWFDLKIFMKTILSVLNSKGVKEGTNDQCEKETREERG